MKDKNALFLIAISFTASLGGFLFGYDTAIISGCNTFLQEQFQLTPALLGWVASSALLGTILGCFVAGFFTDRFGRKKALIVAAVFLTVSATGSALVPQFNEVSESGIWLASSMKFAFNSLIIFRLIGGIGVGITMAVAPVYISELALPKNRGRFVSIYQLSITLGILFAFLADWLILKSAGEAAGQWQAPQNHFFGWLFENEIWRGMFATEIPVAFLFLVLLLYTPESPRWLIARGNDEKALQIMIRTSGGVAAVDQMKEIKASIWSEKSGLKELFQPFLRIPLWIGVLLPMFAHLSGIAAIMYFAPNILNESVHSVESSFLGAILVGLVNSVFTFIAIAFVEKFGRKKLLLIGAWGAFLSLSAVGILFALGSTLVIIPLLVYVASFAFSYGPMVWVIISEIFPTRIRGLAVSIGSLSLNITGFLITLSNPVLLKAISPAGTFFLYAVLTIPALWFIWKFVPETKGKSLEEIERSWR